MRKIFSIIPATMLGAVLIFTACQKDQTNVNSGQAVLQNNPLSGDRVQVVEDNLQDYKAMVVSNKARLAELGINVSRDCMETVTVPDDYATIQEAVDNVCDYGDVIVMEGTYTEIVTIYKPGLHIKANGAVTLNGQFYLTEDADDCHIQKFHIDPAAGGADRGIFGYFLEGGEIMQNSIVGPSVFGIYLWSSSGVKIMQNEVSDMAWGIFCGNGGNEGEASHNNTISGNTVTGSYNASCIGFQAECDNNLVNGNTVTDNPTISNAGIMFYGFSNMSKNCDNNVVKNNTVTGTGHPGIWVLGGSDNTVGPNNTSNENTYYGIFLSDVATGNHVFNNTALNTVEAEGIKCDISDGSTGENTEKNNTADCIEGF